MAKSSSNKKNRQNKGGKSVSKDHASNSGEIIANDKITASDMNQRNQVPVPSSANVDRISRLPLKAKVCILSFLPTRSAVATCILSKAWRHIWTFLPILNFNDLPTSMKNQDKIFFTEAKYASFRYYVNRVLLLQAAQCLKRLHFEMYDCFPVVQIHEWMLVISKLQVQELYCISRIYFVRVPDYIFIQKNNLVVLNLEGFSLSLPDSFRLPCLRIFSLTKCVLYDMRSDDPWTRFLCNCPVLESLVIENCDKVPEKLSICSSKMKLLRVVSNKDPKRTVLIETPKLIVLNLSVGRTLSIVNDLSSLIEARIDIRTSSMRWIELLQRICCTKTLFLCQIILEDFTATMQLPTFQNLTHLVVDLTSWSIVLQIIRHAPKLVSFVILKLMYGWPDQKPRIKYIRLERIEYYCSDGKDSFQALRYFLSHSALLKKVIIYTPSSLDTTKENDILKKLLKLRMASNHCKVIVVNEGCNSISEDTDTESEGSDYSNDESEIETARC